MMSRPPSAVGYRRPLSHHAHVAMRMKADRRYRVSCFSLCFSTKNESFVLISSSVQSKAKKYIII